MRHRLLFLALVVILGGPTLALAGPHDEVAAATGSLGVHTRFVQKLSLTYYTHN
jgi:hypothetical protein